MNKLVAAMVAGAIASTSFVAIAADKKDEKKAAPAPKAEAKKDEKKK